MANKKNPTPRASSGSKESAGVAGDESVPGSAEEQHIVGAEHTPEEEVQRMATEYYQKLSEAATRLTEQSRKLYDMSHDYARQHPVELIAGAFVAGLVVGLLTGRD